MRSTEVALQVLDLTPNERQSERGILLLTLAVNYRDTGDISQASQSYADAITLLLAAENIIAAIMAVDQLVRLLGMQGKLVQAVEVCQQMLDASAEFSVSENLRVLSSDMARMNMSQVLYERNALGDAELHVRNGIKQARRAGYLQSLIVGQILLARILQASGDSAGATKSLQAAINNTQMDLQRMYQAELTACQVHLWLAQEDIESATRWARESNLNAETEILPQNEYELISLARVLVAHGRAASDGMTLTRALGLIDRLAQSAQSAGRTGHLIDLLTLQALALDAQDELDQALACLGRALSFAAPQGYVRIFLDNGEPIIRLLKEAARREIAEDYAIKLLSAIDTDTRPDGPKHPPSSLLVEPLSDREMEVLDLMAQDLSYKEIADQITVSLNTVRTHVKNIYSKLMVHKRSQAITKARELHLL